MKLMRLIAEFITLIGSLNWGLWGFFQFDPICWIFHGSDNTPSRIIYSLIGVSALYTVFCRLNNTQKK